MRKRLDLSRPVPDELIRQCLQIALQAPSGSNRQGWHWLVITDADQRRAVGQVYRRPTEEYLASSGSAARLFADDPDRAPVQHRVGDSVAYLGERMADVPVLVLPCLQTGRDLPAGNQAGLWGSLLPAVVELHAGRPGSWAGHRLDHAAPGATRPRWPRSSALPAACTRAR